MLAGPLLEENLHIKALDATIKEISEKFATNTIAWFVEAVLNSVIEKNDKSRVASGGLIAAMLSRGLLGEGQFLTALGTLLEFAEDLLVDIPKFWDFLAQVVAPTLAPSGPLPLAVIRDSATQAKLLEGDLGAKCSGGKYAAALLNEMGKQGKSTVASAWRDSGLSWAEFLPPPLRGTSSWRTTAWNGLSPQQRRRQRRTPRRRTRVRPSCRSRILRRSLRGCSGKVTLSRKTSQ